MFFGKASLGLALSFLVMITVVHCDSDPTFPKGFAWGVASAAYQIEGGWNVTGKGLSIWDVFSHIPNTTFNNETGDVADDFYDLYHQDIDLMKSLGIKDFRMSLSWPRLLPNGTVNLTDFTGASQEGITFYNSVLDALANAGITPWVTLYHWDLPAALIDKTNTSGWLNENISTIFRDYAEFCFITFGDKVKNWLTFNEISTYSFQGYGSGVHAPGRCSDDRCKDIGGGGNTGTEPYIVTHNSLISHALAVAVYKTKYQQKQGGVIGLTINSAYALPWNPNDPRDVAAAENDLTYQFGWFGDPIVFGDYPAIMKKNAGDRIPAFNSTHQTLLKGSFDFIGINYYTASFAQHTDTPGDNWSNDGQYIESTTDAFGNEIGPTADSTWLHVYPEGLRGLINWIVDRYSVNSTQTPFYIFENGVSVPHENDLPIKKALNDTFRVDYIRGHLTAVVETIIKDGINVMGYFSWSILDNYEWASGTSVRFGMVYVDYNSTGLTRYPKASAKWYNDVIGNLTGGQNFTTAVKILSEPTPVVDLISI